VTGLGHGEAAHQLAGDEVAQVLLVVPLGAELEDRPAEEAELDADLDQHREVAERQGLEGCEGGTDVAAPAVLLREPHAGLPGGGHLDHHLLDPLAERRPVQRLRLLEDRGVVHQVAAHQLPDPGVAAVKEGGQSRDVDGRLHVARRLRLGGLGAGLRRLLGGLLIGRGGRLRGHGANVPTAGGG
jgi:hypothetical protein